jgi:hypothetical protein
MENKIYELPRCIIFRLGKEDSAIIGLMVNEVHKIPILLTVNWCDRPFQVGAIYSTDPVKG